MPPLDWVILSNSAWHRVAIHKQQIAAILDDLNSDRQRQNDTRASFADDSAGTMIEDFITRSASSGSTKCHTRLPRRFEARAIPGVGRRTERGRSASYEDVSH